MGENEAYQWDSSLLFETDERWEAAYDRYETRVSSLSFDETVVDDPDSLLAALETRDELYLLDSRLYHYALCQSWTDVTDETAQNRTQRVKRLTARRDAALEELEAAITETGRASIEELVDDEPALERYTHFFDDIFRRSQYALEPAVEAAVAALTESLDAPSRILQTIDDRSFEPPTVTGPDGEPRELTQVAYRGELTDPDREYRRRVYEAYRDALCQHRAVVTRTYIEHVRSQVSRANIQGYESALAREVDDLIPAAVIDGLVDGIRERRAFQGRYERLRKQIGVDSLRPWDLRAPLADTTPEIPYDEARDLVVEALAPLGEAYQRRLEQFLSEPRVDVYPAETKRDVPAVAFGAEGAEAFVYLNYEADLESLYFFVHELGHAMHYLHAREAQPRVHQRLPWEVSEIPSFLNEILLVNHLWHETELSNAAVLDTFLRKLPLPTAARGVAFVRRVEADIRDEADIDADRLDQHHRELQSAFHDPVSFSADDGPLWMGHNLDRDPYHPYLYLLGSVGALAASRRLRKGSLATEEYRSFLRAGDSAYPMDLLDSIGIAFDGDALDDATAEYDRLLGAIR